MNTYLIACIAVVTGLAGSVQADYISIPPDGFLVFSRGQLGIDRNAEILGNVGGGSTVWLGKEGIFGGNILSNGAFSTGEKLKASGWILSNDDLFIGHDSRVEGAITIGGNGSFARKGNFRSITVGGNANFGKHTELLGDLRSNENVWISRNSLIDGDVMHGGTFGTGNDVTITGEVSVGTTTPDVWNPEFRNTPTFSTSGTGSIYHGEHSDVTLAPGDYGSMNVGRESTVRLTAGTYNFASLWFGRKTELLMDNTDGKIYINVVGTASFDREAQFDLLYDNNNDLLVQSGNAMYFGRDSNLEGNFRSFGNSMSIGKHTDISGTVYSDGTLWIGQKVSVIPAPPTSVAVLGLIGLASRRRRE